MRSHYFKGKKKERYGGGGDKKEGLSNFNESPAKGGWWVSNPRPTEPQSVALANCATATISPKRAALCWPDSIGDANIKSFCQTTITFLLKFSLLFCYLLRFSYICFLLKHLQTVKNFNLRGCEGLENYILKLYGKRNKILPSLQGYVAVFWKVRSKSLYA